MTADLTSVRQYLEMFTELAKRNKRTGINGYRCMEEFVLRNGRQMDPSPLPSGIKRGPMKQCYQNAGRIALSRLEFTYVEGYAISIIPVLHGWLIDSEGRVVDPTWKDGLEYFGVPISTRYLRRHVLEHGVWGVIDGWDRNWPILHAKSAEWRVS